MARAQKRAKIQRKTSAPPSHKAANAAGYAKRQSKKTASISGVAISDVYEYQPEKVRRAKVKLQYEKDELLGAGEVGSGSEDEGSEGGSRGQRRRPRLVGEGEDDERIDDDEDEEIDSDAAFEESDEERFAGFNFSQKKKGASAKKIHKKKAADTSRSVQFAEVDLNEEEDEEGEDVQEDESQASSSDEQEQEQEQGDPDEFIDVLDIMDGKEEPDSRDDMGEVEDTHKPKSAEVQDEDEEDEEMVSDIDDASDGEEEEEDEPISASEGEDDDHPALQDLERFVTCLDAGQKRKAPDGENGDKEIGADATRARKRRLLKETTEAGEENEFAAHVGGGKLKLDDLLAPLAAQSLNLQSLKKSAKILASQSGSAKIISAPLPQRTAERLDREAAYEQTKEEVDKWKTTMQRIKEAEHLSFPLQAQPTGKTSNLELAAKFKPTTEMESAVDKLLKSAKMRDEDIVQTESLKMNHLSVEEVATRRAELAKMRDLMFRTEAKAKRVAKIKSKTYRRLKKKERAKLAANLGEGEDDDEDDEEARMKREIERARERATLRHKNTGKWAKAMKARGELDEDQRRDITEMLDRGERLRRKIRGDRSSDEESDDEDEDGGDEEDQEGAVRRIKASAFEELAGLGEDAPAGPPEGEKKGKSIFEMKFMKDAMARDQRKVDEMVDDFIKEIGGPIADDNEGEHADVDADADNQPYGTAVSRVGGRATYRPGPTAPGPSTFITQPSFGSDTSSVTLKSTDLPGSVQPETPLTISPITERSVLLPPTPAEDVNPWLIRSEDSSRLVPKKHEIVVGKNSGTTEKSRNKLRKQEKKREEEKQKAKEDATVDIEMSNVMTLGSTSGPPSDSSQKQQAKAKSAAAVPKASSAGGDDDDSDANSEVEEQEKLLDRKGKGKGKAKANGIKAFEQRDLVALAFAGDSVVRDFAEQKHREMQEDAPHEVDTTLAGWGSWGGKGTKKAPPKPHLIKKVAGIDPKSRADYNKAHVIISEKRDKKASKYLVKDLPFPYTSKAQYERSMETPIGIEWNTRLGFQRATLPKIVKKPGVIITPLEKL